MVELQDLTIDEKITLLTGHDFWRVETLGGKLPEVFLSDGPSGLRKCKPEVGDGAIKATAMPTLSVVSNTWNKELSFLDGKTIADECIENDASVILAPGVNIKRNPLNGRNFEYFSEDPYLSGFMAKAFIEGVQGKGIGTSLKHFACNNSEYEREFQSSEVDERTLREIYFTAFEIALRAKPWTVMCSYNPVNGVYASENKWLLNDVLRGDFGFKDLIVSDWGAVHNSAKAVRASLDLRMAHSDSAFNEIKKGFEDGLITEKDIDACVLRVLDLVKKAKNAKKVVEMDRKTRHQNAVEIAKEGIVLLKNEDILPIKKSVKKIAVFGEFAQNPPIGGGGSSFVETAFKQTSLSELLKEEIKCEVYYRNVYTPNNIYAKKVINEYGVDADLMILCVGEDKTTVAEGFNRQSLKISPLQEEVIDYVSKINKNLVVVVYGGGAIDMSNWIEKVKGVVFAGFAGEGVNEALAGILTGRFVPSGKLSETFPLSIEDTVTKYNVGNGYYDRYDEGVFVGYRHYDEKGKEVLFPFGHGLSYANFEYSNLEIKKLGETDYEVSYDIKNTSAVDAKEVSQLYISDLASSVARPKKELKGFRKDWIKAGETKHLTLTLDFRAFAFYSLPLKDWYVENGKFKILVGSSSRDIRLEKTIEIQLPENTQYSYQK